MSRELSSGIAALLVVSRALCFDIIRVVWLVPPYVGVPSNQDRHLDGSRKFGECLFVWRTDSAETERRDFALHGVTKEHLQAANLPEMLSSGRCTLLCLMPQKWEAKVPI